MSRRLLGPLGLAAVGALAGCTGTAAPHQLASSAPAVSRAPSVPATPPVWSAAPPSGPAGQLAAVAPRPGSAGMSFEAWFAGLPLDQDGDRLLIAYPSMSASSDGRSTVAHAKVAVFWCQRRVGPNYAGCQRRAVEYGDLTAPAVTLVRQADGTVTVSGRFPTYTYGTGADRDPKVRPGWTGRTYLIQVDLEPSGPGTTLVPTGGTVTLGAGTGAVSARLDTGYPNRVRTRPAPSATPRPSAPPRPSATPRPSPQNRPTPPNMSTRSGVPRAAAT
ncbi:MAG TPA: hypothetical protein VMU51_26955 [Mycobacteriales bacterium]|nr:hypothetical protein [Mycobacteriales bacterium]